MAIKLSRSLVVQFSHFLVKEFLSSTRLATSSGDVSRYHVDLEPVHTISAQVCLSVFLQPDDHVEQNDVEKSSPCIDRMLTDSGLRSVRLTSKVKSQSFCMMD
jgi:hypothetical protein